MPANYQPIENYGVVGDMHTVALVGLDGSVDWWCYPHFDSPSVFGALLDSEKGGHFRISPCVEPEGSKRKQLYLPETNVLITRFLTPDGVGEVTDFMPVSSREDGHGHRMLIRRVEVVRGSMEFSIECRPAFDYARTPHEVEVWDDGVAFKTPGLTLCLSTPVRLVPDGGAVRGTIALKHGETATFVLREPDATDHEDHVSERHSLEMFRQTVQYWRRWVGQSTYRGRWREMVNRSALVLKLLTFEDTGAIIAAPTTSLPESIGGVRNWDYRYTWVRDASFTLYGLIRIGFTEEANAFMSWLDARVKEPEPDGSLQVVYGVHGEHELGEVTLDHLDGYRGSKPVRIGNAAAKQLQLDIYGELMDAVYLYNKHAQPIDYHTWVYLRRILNWLCENWQRPDEGIWEIRGPRQYFVHSRVMCWVALDRGLRLAERRSLPADRERWIATRDEIYEEIMRKGWNEERKAFVQAYGSTTLDAAILIMPLVFFVAPTDPRMLSTIDAMIRELASDSLVYRYRTDQIDDGVDGHEGTFSMCSFWLVEALTRAGRLDEARLFFEKMLTYANHLGLYAEEIGPSGEALGNFPQAFTHLSVISAAINLDAALGTEPPPVRETWALD